jgi:hypothetical protein
MSAAAILERLSGVRRTGPGTWRARCPSHGSKGLTLAIRESDDGKVLVKCFAECSVNEVVGAVGLRLEDLFPPRPTNDFVKGTRRPFPAADILRCVADEIMIAWVISRDMERGKTIPAFDFERLSEANRRIQAALDLVNDHVRR